MAEFITYYRVSKAKQGIDGLGIAAQHASVTSYVIGKGEVLAEYEEVENGKRSDRPQLAKALAHAKRLGATLLIAKLDRLARNVHFISGLMEAGVPFVAVDMPNATPFMLHIYAAVAEEEARAISTRTKAALKAYREEKRVSRRVKSMYPEGVPQDVVEATAGKLGAQLPQCRNGTHESCRRGAMAAAESKRSHYNTVMGTIRNLRSVGATLREIAAALNAAGWTNSRGNPYSASVVHDLVRAAR